jgi:membrane glycosyltransferase
MDAVMSDGVRRSTVRAFEQGGDGRTVHSERLHPPGPGVVDGHAPGGPRASLDGRDTSDSALLPPEAPLPMPTQDFDADVVPRVPRPRARWVPRAALFGGAAFLTLAFAYELWGVLSFVRMTPIQFVFWLLATVSFGWIALGSLSAAMGFLPLFAGDRADTLPLPEATAPPLTRTALLFPVYNEDPAEIAGAIDAVTQDLDALGAAGAFDVFVLSDTRDPAAGAREHAVYGALRRAIAGRTAVYYRRRRHNSERKAGNIRDWVERFGGAYPHFVILDADSVMSGRALVRLALAMEINPDAGLIQTVPRLVGGTTVLQRLVQFACNTYGPAVAAGLAVWHRDRGNYWGHNAIIRTGAFASAAGLPVLPGGAPFGGHILSHDFVEAVLLQRAGWGVHMVPSEDGSWEGLPPALVEFVTRDRRWAQGNIQHLAIVTAGGLTAMGRVHLTMGALAYVVSGIWAASLAVGAVLLLQGQQLIPSYFEDSKTLFPVWPVIDPGAALRLFLATMAVVLLPKMLGLVLALQRVRRTSERGGSVRAILAVAAETVYSMLIAPILMVTQTSALVQILLGQDAGWTPQNRRDAGISLGAALRFHARHVVLGVGIGGLCWWTTPELAIWMSPVIAGLVLAPLVNWHTSRPAGPLLRWLLATPEERSPAATVVSARRLAALWHRRVRDGEIPTDRPA